MPAETPAFFCFCEERNDTANIAHSLRRHCERSEAIQSRVFNARKTRLQQSQAPHARLLDGARFARKDSWRFASVVIARSRRRRGNPSDGSHAKMDCRVASLLAMTMKECATPHPGSGLCPESALSRWERGAHTGRQGDDNPLNYPLASARGARQGRMICDRGHGCWDVLRLWR